MYHDMLKIFREDRRLTKNAGDLFGNVYKELGEVYDEIKKNNVHGMIEEFGDVIIFCENYIATLDVEMPPLESTFSRTPIESLTRAMIAISKFKKEGGYPLFACNAIEDSANAIYSLGYDAQKVVYEKAKVICSRKGAWNEQTQKWEKDPMQDKSTLHVPDYESCKICEQ